MFTGIVQGLATVAQVNEADNFKSFRIQFPGGKADGVQIGASVAINGTCLTVTAIEQDVLSFDVMSETLRATSLGALQVGAGRQDGGLVDRLHRAGCFAAPSSSSIGSCT